MCIVALTTFASQPVSAQDYPVKPVTFITPAAAGNSPDVITRLAQLPACLEDFALGRPASDG
jgi:tripartite-type tricarboxylate transporter receptor subunit TctC